MRGFVSLPLDICLCHLSDPIEHHAKRCLAFCSFRAISALLSGFKIDTGVSLIMFQMSTLLAVWGLLCQERHFALVQSLDTLSQAEPLHQSFLMQVIVSTFNIGGIFVHSSNSQNLTLHSQQSYRSMKAEH